MTSNPDHDDAVVRIFTFYVGKAEEEVVRKIASQVHCRGGGGITLHVIPILFRDEAHDVVFLSSKRFRFEI